MVIIVKSLGVLMIFAAVILQLNVSTIKDLLAFFKVGKRLYYAAVIRVIIASLLLLAASRCANQAIIITLGVIFLASGLMVFVFGDARFKKIIESLQKQPELIQRAVALLPFLMGVLIVYSA
mgnify:FL=1